jgi:hypothetical protein
LHAGQHARDAAENDVPDRASSGGAFDLKLGNDAFFYESDAGFTDVTVDDESISGHGFRGATSQNP